MSHFSGLRSEAEHCRQRRQGDQQRDDGKYDLISAIYIRGILATEHALSSRLIIYDEDTKARLQPVPIRAVTGCNIL